MMTKKRFITKKALANKLELSPSTVFRWAKIGELPLPFRLGPNRIVWDEDEVDEFIEKKKITDRGFSGNKPRDKTCRQ